MPHHVNGCVRESISWRPQWSEIYERWTRKFVSHNLWRCDPVTDDFEDLMQDAKFIFLKLTYAYPAVIDPPQFMSLYKTSIQNYIHDKSRYKRRKDASNVYTSVDAADLFSGRIGETTNVGYVVALLDELPEELKLVLHTLTHGRIRLRIEKRKSTKLRERESLNKKLCRKLNLTTTTDPIGDLYRFIAS